MTHSAFDALASQLVERAQKIDEPTFKRPFVLLSGALLVSVVLGLTSCARIPVQPPPKAAKVDIGGCRLNTLIQGRGSPVVVLESGLGDTISSWSKVQSEIARFSTVPAYDRAGLGESDPASIEPRSSLQIARELHTLLEKAKLRPPYVFVGHSLGGLHVRQFAFQYPAETAGLVLVDPSAEDWAQSLKDQFPEEYQKHVAWRDADHSPGMEKELIAWPMACEQARTAAPLPDVPVVLFTSLQGNTGGTKILLDLHRAWLKTLPHAKHITTEKSGHYLHVSEPELVIGAVSNIVFSIRSH